MKTEIGLVVIALAIGGAVSYKELHKPNTAPTPVTSTAPTAAQNNSPASSTPAVKVTQTPTHTVGVKPPSISGGGERDGSGEHHDGEGREGNDD